MTLKVGTAALALAACQREQTAAANQAGARAAQPVSGGDVRAAERLVSRRIAEAGLADAGVIQFSEPIRSASEGVPVICGAYEQNGARHRYIVVGREEAFIEPQMRAGEMERAVAEFCREGGDNTPTRATPPAGEKG